MVKYSKINHHYIEGDLDCAVLSYDPIKSIVNRLQLHINPICLHCPENIIHRSDRGNILPWNMTKEMSSRSAVSQAVLLLLHHQRVVLFKPETGTDGIQVPGRRGGGARMP